MKSIRSPDFSSIRAYCRTGGASRSAMSRSALKTTCSENISETSGAPCRRRQKRGLSQEGRLPGALKIERKAPTLYRAYLADRSDDKRLICSYAYATAEENASGGIVVTAPTCGASGVLPAVLLYLRDKYGISEDKILHALAAAGMVGNVVKTNASVSGAEAGCQAEIGTATSMAAAAVCSNHGTVAGRRRNMPRRLRSSTSSDSPAIPSADMSRFPCIERNAVAALRALDSADLADVLRRVRARFPSTSLSVRCMRTGRDLDARYRETGEGGLASGYKIC